MGNGFSPLIFNVAIDPLLWQLTDVVAVDIISGYMDDLSVATSDIDALLLVQRIIHDFRLAAEQQEQSDDELLAAVSRPPPQVGEKQQDGDAE